MTVLHVYLWCKSHRPGRNGQRFLKHGRDVPALVSLDLRNPGREAFGHQLYRCVNYIHHQLRSQHAHHSECCHCLTTELAK